MALNKKGGFGFDLEEAFKDVESVDSVKPTHTHTVTDTHTPTHTDVSTHTHTDTHTHNEEDIVVKETKKFRVQLLTYKSMVDQVDAYGKRRGMSRTQVYEAAMMEYLDKHDK